MLCRKQGRDKKSTFDPRFFFPKKKKDIKTNKKLKNLDINRKKIKMQYEKNHSYTRLKKKKETPE